MTEDLKRALERITALEQQLARQSGRLGRISKSEKGRVLVEYAKADVGDSKHVKSAWIRTAHGGAQTESRQWAPGEAVFVQAMGGNPEHAILHPAGFSDNHPHDKDDSDDATTARWRKPPKKDQQGQGQQQGGGGAGTSYESDSNDHPAWKDDDKDHRSTTNHEKHSRQIGDAQYEVTADHALVKHGKRQYKATKDDVTMTDGEATVKIKGGKIYLIGEVFLGDEGAADRVATEKTRDSMGGQLQEPFSTKAKAK